MDKTSIFTNKIVALYERLYNRDLYDVYFFLQKWFELNENLIKERTWLWIQSFIVDLISKLNSEFDSNNVLSWLGDLVNEKQKNFIKTKLLPETISNLQTTFL